MKYALKNYLWVGVLFVPLCIYGQIAQSSTQQIQFEYYDQTKLGIGNSLTCLMEDGDGRIWVGTQGSGIIIYDGYVFNYVQHFSGDTSGLPSNRILGLLRLKNDDILIGTAKGVCRFDSKQKIIQKLNFIHPAYAFWNDFSESLAEDENGILWIGTADGLIKYDPNNANTEIFRTKLPPSAHPDRNINFFIRILQDPIKEDIIWCGSQYGLRSFDKKEMTFTDHPHPPIWHASSSEYQKYSIFDMASSPQKIWLAAWKSGGILSYDVRLNTWDQFLYKGGIPSNPYYKNDVFCVEPLSDTSALFGAVHGLGIANANKGELEYLHEFDTFRTGYVRESIIDSKGIIWLACEKALVRSLQPTILKKTAYWPPHLTQFLANGKEVDISQNGSKLLFKKEIKELIFETSLINPINTTEVEYRIKLSGYDSEWRHTRDQRLVTYSNIKGGSYTFKYEAKFRDGDWTEGIPLHFEIEKPYYLTPLFLAFMIGLLALILFAIVKITARIARREENVKNEYERKLIEAELTSLRSQMNPHFIFNSLNSIYNFILNNDTDNAAEYLVKFSKLMRMVLAHSKKKMIPLSEELEVVNLYLELEQIRFNDKFKYLVQVDQSLDRQQVMIPPMLTQPFIENAIWHGLMHKQEKGNLMVSYANTSDEAVSIKILDDGIGRKKSKEINRNKKKKSFGMDITQKRIKAFETLFGKQAKFEILDLVDAGGSAAGTEIRLDIPIINKMSSL